MAKYIGKEMSRVDGVAKVTGQAKYAAEYQVPNLAHGYIVQSTIAKGSIKSIETGAAEKASGVIRVFTHLNTPKITAKINSFQALQSEKIVFSDQPVAVVVAETFEQARYAASLVKVSYDAEKSSSDMVANLSSAYVPNPARAAKPRGNPAEAMQNAPVKIEAEYTIPIEHHNPMEPHGAIAFWQGDKLTLFDKTQGVYAVRGHLVSIFGIPEDNVNVISLFVGGAFGSSLNPNYYPHLTAMAAREIKRPVKLIYTRRQMFTGNGYRPYTWQKVSIS